MSAPDADQPGESNRLAAWRTFMQENGGRMFQLALLFAANRHAAEEVLIQSLHNLDFNRSPELSDVRGWESAVLASSIQLCYRAGLWLTPPDDIDSA
jgi:hypothetical protein